MAAVTDRHARERAVIRQVLSSQIDEPGIQRALELWDRQYAGRKSVPIIEFVNAIEAVQALESKARHGLRLELYRGMIQAAAGSVAQAARAATTRPSPAARPQLDGTPAEIVFMRLVQHYGDALRELGPQVSQPFLAALRLAVDSRKLPAVLGDAVATIAMRGSVSAGVQWGNTARMQMLAHAVYEAACKAAGPVAADRMLLDGIEVAEALPAAKLFSPRQLL